MATKHSLLTDTDGIHEPKNITTANEHEVYVADGSDSGSWQKVGNQSLEGITSDAAAGQLFQADGAGGFVAIDDPSKVYGEAYAFENATPTTFAAGNTFYVIGATGITWSLGHDDAVNWDTDHFTVSSAGDYRIDLTISMLASANSKKYSVQFAVDDGGGITPLVHAKGAWLTSSASSIATMSIHAIDHFDAGDKVYVVIKNETDTTSVTILNVNFIFELKEAD